MKIVWPLVLVVLLVLLPGVASPQSTITADRPGIGSGSGVVEQGLFQVEGGVQFSGQANVDEFSVGQILLRWGVGDRLELQGLLSSFTLRRNGMDTEGLQDMGIGGKVNLTRQGPQGLALSLLGTATFPTGSDAFSAEETLPGLVLLADMPMAPDVGLSANLGYANWMADAENVLSVTLTPSLALRAQENLALFWGWAGFFRDSGSSHFMEGGVTWTPTKDLQLDLNGGVRLDAEGFFLGAGIATRR